MMHATGKRLAELEKRVIPTTERLEVWWNDPGTDRYALDREAGPWLSQAEVDALPETPGVRVTRIFVTYDSDRAAKA